MNLILIAVLIYLLIGAGFMYWAGPKVETPFHFVLGVVVWLPVFIWATGGYIQQKRKAREWRKITTEWKEELQSGEVKPGWSDFYQDMNDLGEDLPSDDDDLPDLDA